MSQRNPLFRRNSSGPGYHPASWQGWLILIGAIVVLVALVIVLRQAL